ncbi:MAG: hypothetical protein JNN15_20525, partial [Blastocatellia bacterium]|nr:hypothetical protein [Blastocatellia bacterium]
MASKNSTESVNCFNSVQSSGVVLVLDKNLTIVQASHNVCHHLNIENIFNSNIETVLAVEKEFLIECLSELNTTPLLLPITVNQFCIFAHSN